MREDLALSGQRKSLGLERGAFVIRYSAAEDEAFPPKIEVLVPSGREDYINPILHPDCEKLCCGGQAMELWCRFLTKQSYSLR